MDVFDMQRVEGPARSTRHRFFGTATLGGAVDYIINPVSLDKYDVHVQTGVSKTVNASDPGYTAKIAVNVPLIDDVFGIRVTAIQAVMTRPISTISALAVTARTTRKIDDYRLNALWKNQ